MEKDTLRALILARIEALRAKNNSSIDYRRDIYLIPIIVCITSIVLIQLYKNTPKTTHDNSLQQIYNEQKKSVRTIYVDLSGAITRPHVYMVQEGTRLFQLIESAGGFSESCDTAFFARNYNMSIVLSDQMKIHVPSLLETSNGLITENRKVVSLSNRSQDQSEKSPDINKLVSINEASQADLESLPGIGSVTAKHIIATRPYDTIDQIVEKGVLKKALFDKIKDQITY